MQLLTSLSRSRLLAMSTLAVIALICFVLDILSGTVDIPTKDVIKILLSGQSDHQAWVFIIEKIRLPKALTAVLAGCGLSVSGLQMQTLFRNPLAGPSELGITAGAGLGVAAIMLSGGSAAGIYATRQLGLSGSWLVVVMASFGAGIVFTLIMIIAGRVRDHVVLLIVGVMIGTITLSVVSIWQYFSQPEQLQEYIMWTFGSLGGVTGIHLATLAIVVVFGLILAFISSKTLNILLLGENYARSMGLPVTRARWIIMAGTCLLTGSITAFCGPIGFIGIAIPHVARSLFATSDHRILIPGVCLCGTILLLVCDILTQIPGTQSVLPINVITALLGAPVVIWVILSRSGLKSSFS